jgi:hypothetical protein
VSDTDPIGWRAVTYGSAVTSDDGARVGTVREMLGSDADDIFHGVRVKLAGADHDVMISADDVASLTVGGVRTSLSRAEVAALAEYDEVATYHLASVGWLRKHLGWQKDAKSDEEPG